MRMKKIIMGGISVLLLFAIKDTAYASALTPATVTLDSGGNLSYTSTGSIESAFAGIAPGEERTIDINLKNDYSMAGSFYIDAKSLENLQNTVGSAAGGAYDVSLALVNNQTASSTVVYDSSVGGATGASSEGNKTGLTDIKALSGNLYLITLASGESAIVEFTIALDGTSNGNIYQASSGNFIIDFSVAYNKLNDTVVNQVTTQQEPMRYTKATVVRDVLVAVKTGDSAAIGTLLFLLSAGAVAFVLAGRKRSRDESNKKII